MSAAPEVVGSPTVSGAGLRDRWRRLGRTTRAGLVVGTALVAVNLTLGALDSATRGADPAGPVSSSFSTNHQGLAAYAELLARAGHGTLPQRGALAKAQLDPRDTVVVLDAGDISDADVEALRPFVGAGGRLVAGGTDPQWLRGFLPDFPGWAPSGTHSPAAQVGGATYRLRTAGQGRFLAGDVDGSQVVEATVDGGTILALADASPLQNKLLDRADNAAFGLALAGDRGRPVVFAEGVHGYGRASGIGAIPDRWKIAIVGTLLAALLLMVATGRVVGPPEDERRELPPPRRAYVDALAITLARTKPRGEALAPLQASVRARLAARATLPPDAGPTELTAAARRLGWSNDEITALYAPADDDARVLAVGRALVRAKGTA